MSTKGRQENNPGYKDAQTYSADPDNAEVPDSFHNEHDIGKTAFALQNSGQAIEDVEAVQETADEALANADAAQIVADEAEANAQSAIANAAAAQATADALEPQVVVAQEAADAAQVNADQALFGFFTVATIAERDALSPDVDDKVAVTDSGDGKPRLYRWDGAVWIDETAEYITYAALNVSVNSQLIAVNADNVATNAESIAILADQVAANADANADTAITTSTVADSNASTAVVASTNATNIATIAQNGVDGINASIGVAGGVAPLDGGGKVSESYLPSSVTGAVFYQGTWDATNRSPRRTYTGRLLGSKRRGVN